jgi:predicted exporter
MSTPAKKNFALAGLCIFVLAQVVWLLSIDYSQKLSLDVLSLLPHANENGMAKLTQEVVNGSEKRLIMCSIHGDADEDKQKRVANRFQKLLAQSPLIEKSHLGPGPSDEGALYQWLHTNRFDLLLPSWLSYKESEFAKQSEGGQFSEWLAERIVEDLDAVLNEPESIGFADIIPSDPLLLLVRQAKYMAGIPTDSNGFFVWAVVKEANAKGKHNQQLVNAVESSWTNAQKDSSLLGMNWTAYLRFASKSESEIRSELVKLNLLTAIGVLAILATFLKPLSRLSVILVIVLLANLTAWSATLLAFDSVNIIALVVGSLLTGVSIDFGLHILLHQGYAGSNYSSVIRDLRLPLAASAGSSAIGFLMLLFSELLLLRQIGCFVAVGLTASFVFCFLVFPVAGKHKSQKDKLNLIKAPLCVPLWAVLAITVAIGMGIIWQEEHNELQQLSVDLSELKAEAVKVFETLGKSESSTTLITTNDNAIATITEARMLLSELSGDAWNWAQLLPTEQELVTMKELHKQLSALPTTLKSQLDASGYDTASFRVFFDDFSAYLNRTPQSPEILIKELDSLIDGPMDTSLYAGNGIYWIATHVPADFDISSDLPNTFRASQTEVLNDLFSKYYTSAGRLALFSIAAMIGILALLYGPSKVLPLIASPVCATTITCGLFGWLHWPVNLFHLLGAFLGFCLSIDYSLISNHNHHANLPIPFSVKVSSLTSLAAFGALITSQISAVRDFGLTIFLIIAITLVILLLTSNSKQAFSKHHAE